MKRIRKFFILSISDKYLLLTVVLLVVGIRLGLWLLPFQQLRRILAKARHPLARLQAVGQSPGQIVWAVKVASRYVPAATCLTQALATQLLLVRRGYPAQLRLGVAKGENGALAAHAWVECQGRIVIGGLDNLTRYTPLPPLERERL